MKKPKFKLGDEVYWNDPAGETSDYKTVTSVYESYNGNDEYEDDEDIVYVLDGGTEVYEHECE